MRNRERQIWVLLAFALSGPVGCAGDRETEEARNEALDPTVEACVLCSMVVNEQPAPRAQVVHRDGFRAFLCAASELEPYLAAPSSHGKPVSIYVEVLDSDDEGNVVSTDPHRWIDASAAYYVVEGPSRPVMGTPVLAYASEADARGVAGKIMGRVLVWNELLDFLKT